MDFWLPFDSIEPVCIACSRSQSQSKNKMNIDFFARSLSLWDSAFAKREHTHKSDALIQMVINVCSYSEKNIPNIRRYITISWIGCFILFYFNFVLFMHFDVVFPFVLSFFWILPSPLYLCWNGRRWYFVVFVAVCLLHFRFSFMQK